MSNLESAVGEARPNSMSLRATVPVGIVAFLGLKAGDRLEWRMEFEENRKVVKLTKKAVVEAKKK